MATKYVRFGAWVSKAQSTFLRKGKGSEKIRASLLKVYKVK